MALIIHFYISCSFMKIKYNQVPVGPGIDRSCYGQILVPLQVFQHSDIVLFLLFPQLTSMFSFKSSFNSCLIDIFQASFQVRFKITGKCLFVRMFFCLKFILMWHFQSPLGVAVVQRALPNFIVLKNLWPPLPTTPIVVSEALLTPVSLKES